MMSSEDSAEEEDGEEVAINSQATGMASSNSEQDDGRFGPHLQKGQKPPIKKAAKSKKNWRNLNSTTTTVGSNLECHAVATSKLHGWSLKLT